VLVRKSAGKSDEKRRDAPHSQKLRQVGGAEGGGTDSQEQTEGTERELPEIVSPVRLLWPLATALLFSYVCGGGFSGPARRCAWPIDHTPLYIVPSRETHFSRL